MIMISPSDGEKNIRVNFFGVKFFVMMVVEQLILHTKLIFEAFKKL